MQHSSGVQFHQRLGQLDGLELLAFQIGVPVRADQHIVFVQIVDPDVEKLFELDHFRLVIRPLVHAVQTGIALGRPERHDVGILELDTVPEHLVVVGGSYIALEFAQMYRRFGARVTVVEKGPRLTSREDEDVSAAIKDILEAEGITVATGVFQAHMDVSLINDGPVTLIVSSEGE